MNVMFCVLSLGWMSDVKKGGNHVKIGKEMKFKVHCKFFNPLTPMSDQDRISPYNINTISTR